MFCPNCGTQNRPTAKFCASCGATLAAPPPAKIVPEFAPVKVAAPIALANVMPLDERRHILDKEVKKYQRQGWRVTNRSDTTAQLVYETKASCLVAIILALFLIVPAVLYLMFYKGTKTLFLEVDDSGQVTATPHA